ncbi:MAG: septation ring formation regulator EzrA [Firmicutes bacterium]|nr:septation ring formation regulator EzrA [Bacillota bacterium]
MNSLTLIILTIYVITIVLVILVLNFLQTRKNKNFKKHLEQLEIEKNMIDSTPIAPELSKIEAFLKNEKVETMYGEWKSRLEDIKNNQIPKVTDMLLEADYSLSKMDYKSTLYKIAKLEMELYKVKANSEFLLEEIRTITTSEEKNRTIITKLKTKYRELYEKFMATQAEFGDVEQAVANQFATIAKMFEKFELVMDKNQYTEVTQVMKAIDDSLKHMDIVIEEVPSIELLATSILPKKMTESMEIYKHMVNLGYPLDYLNVEYNIEEAQKKINDIKERLQKLNLEDSLFELKVLLEYFEQLYQDFEKEKKERAIYEEANDGFRKKLNKTNRLVEDIFLKMDDIKRTYHLSNEDVVVLNEVKEALTILNHDFDVFLEHTGNHAFAYSKLTHEIEILSGRLASLQEQLDSTLEVIGGMKEDEVRAREQLEEVKGILKESKAKIRDYNLPVIPKSYFVELKEAGAAIKEIVRELDKKPITINTLNTRVDTARDLVLKLYLTTKEMLKTAMFAEMAIVYGNRYRSSVEDLDKKLTYAEVLFYKGEYHKSLELTINCLNRIEPGIYDKLLRLYGNEK